MTRIAVTGGRTYADERRVHYALDQVHAGMCVTLLIHGAANGADTLARGWAILNGIPDKPCPADWGNIALDVPRLRIRRNRFGKFYNAEAGKLRNIQMLEEERPELLVAFPGGNGTAHCVTQALRRRIVVLSVDADGPISTSHVFRDNQQEK